MVIADTAPPTGAPLRRERNQPARYACCIVGSVHGAIAWGFLVPILRSCLIAAACLAATLAPTPPAQACSAFTAADAAEVWLAKNFDWHFDGGYLVKNPAGTRRVALPLFDGEPVAWVAAHGSLTFTQYGVGLPYGGINQRGLAIEMLWLDETVYPSSSRKTIGELEWIQYQLDTHASVAEVVADADAFSIVPVGGKIHYLLADASGDRALIEFIDGAANVQRADAGPLVCTNDTHHLSQLALAALASKPLKGNSSRTRYARLYRGLDGGAGSGSVANATALLDTVREHGKPYRTQWSAIYEVRQQRIHVRVDGHARALAIDAAELDYAPGSGTAYLDLFDKRASRTAFAPLTAAANLALLRRNLPRVGLDTQLQAISGHLLDPGASTVQALDDRATLHVQVQTDAPGAFARIAVFGNARELAARSSQHAGSVLLTSTRREFAFYNLPHGRYAVGAYHDLNQNNRPDKGEPLAFFRPDPATTGTDFDTLAFDLDTARRSIHLPIR